MSRRSSEHNKFNSIPIRLLSMWRERIRHVVSNWNTVDTVGKYFSVRQKDDGEFLSICVCMCVCLRVRVRVAPRPLCVVAKAAAEANFKIRQQCRQQAITAESSAEQRLERCTLCASERKREHTGGRSKYLLCCESVYFKTQLRRTPFYFHTAASLVQTPYSSSSRNSYNSNNNSNSNNN